MKKKMILASNSLHQMASVFGSMSILGGRGGGVMACAHGSEEEFPDAKQGGDKTTLLRQEMLLTQRADFLIIRDS